MRYTPALAHAEHQLLNAVRLGCPLAEFTAHNARARALNAARTEQAHLDYAADPEGFHNRLHDDALAGDEYFHNPSY